MKRATILAFLVMAQTVAADDLTIPNTFQPNTPARAADVNANFSAVEASVDDNAADIAANTTNISANTANIQANSDAIAAIPAGSGIPVYSQGAELGKFVTPDGSHFFLTSSKGFVYRVHSTRPQIEYLLPARVVFFSDPGCVGTAFVDFRNLWQDSQGYVFAVHQPPVPTFYYSPRGGSPVVNGQLVQSRYDNNVCFEMTDTRNVQEVFPNDPAITGVSNTAPVGPLLLGLP